MHSTALDLRPLAAKHLHDSLDPGPRLRALRRAREQRAADNFQELPSRADQTTPSLKFAWRTPANELALWAARTPPRRANKRAHLRRIFCSQTSGKLTGFLEKGEQFELNRTRTGSRPAAPIDWEPPCFAPDLHATPPPSGLEKLAAWLGKSRLRNSRKRVFIAWKHVSLEKLSRTLLALFLGLVGSAVVTTVWQNHQRTCLADGTRCSACGSGRASRCEAKLAVAVRSQRVISVDRSR